MKSNQAARYPEGASFRHVVQEELARRCARNPQYSLRAFARDLDTDHSSLSQILRGRRNLTERSIRKFGALLELPGEELEQHVLNELRRTPPMESGDNVRVLRELTEDTLAVISGFEHYAILELTHLDEFRPDVSWIARMLGLTPDAINVAIQRLLRIGLLKMASANTWTDCTGDVTNILDGLAFEAVWALSARARKHGLGAALSSPERPHEFSSATLAVDQRRVPEALRILAKARNDVLRVLSDSDRRDHVYHLDLSLIPLTREAHFAKESDTHGKPRPPLADHHQGPRKPLRLLSRRLRLGRLR